MGRVIPARSRRERQRAETIAEIKTAARQHLVASGASGISLRAIAREVGMSAPALYRYFPHLEALLVALCVDLYAELRSYLESRVARVPEHHRAGRLLTAARGFRVWAIAHRAEFSLMFASLLPGAVLASPRGSDARTDPEAEPYAAMLRFASVFGELITRVYQQPERERGFRVDVAAAPDMSAALRGDIAECGAAIGMDVPFDVAYAFHSYWVRLYGLVAMEVFGQLPMIEHSEAYFESELADMAARLGVSLPDIEGGTPRTESAHASLIPTRSAPHRAAPLTRQAAQGVPHHRTGGLRRMLHAGNVLVERYRLQERVDGGGMGDVWRAEDLVLGRRVAIKILRTDRSEERKFKERFRREARAIAALNGPGIVDIYDYGETASSGGDLAFLVMRYIDGAPLSRLIRAHGKLPVSQTLQIIAQVADALRIAHDRGIVHRDIKPGNILVPDDSQVVVVDFGIAHTNTNITLTTTGMVLGTLTYMSPEQAQGQRSGPASDIYSLGIVTYQCLIGAPPFTGSTPAEMLSARLHGHPIVLPPDIPASVQALVIRAMAHHPEDRFDSADSFARACRSITPTLSDASPHLTTRPGRPTNSPPPRPWSDDSEQSAAVSRPSPRPFTGTASPPQLASHPEPTRHKRGRSFSKSLYTICALALSIAAISTLAAFQPWQPHQVLPGISTSVEADVDRSASPQDILTPSQVDSTRDEHGPTRRPSPSSSQDSSASPSSTTSATSSSTSSPRMVEVPDVLSRDEQGASDSITRAGLEPSVIYAGNGQLSCGVIGQDPVAGERVTERTTVTITVERAEESCPE